MYVKKAEERLSSHLILILYNMIHESIGWKILFN
uniref:Uncharacterized protein n=1 Tax=Anguilla anguilla TaxID=7936 RepID=A0A0E9Y1B1_ANGAN